MIIAIVGGRDRILTDQDILQALPCPLSMVSCIVSGAAKGVDTCAASFARLNNIQLIEFKPNYKKYGRKAPLIRNTKLVQISSHVLAFPGSGSGTRHSISQAKKYNIPCSVFPLQNKNQIAIF